MLDLLDREKVLRKAREQALDFLENLTKGGDTIKEQEQVEKRIISILQNQENTLEQLDSHLSQLRQKEAQLDEEIKMKRMESETAEKRLEGLSRVKPTNYNEQNQLEAELSHLYRIYVEKIRNHDYMESKLEQYLQEEKKHEARIKSDLFKIGQASEAVINQEIFDQNEIIADYEEEARMKNVFRFILEL